MNILICSAGRRVKLVEYFKQELHKIDGKVVAIDCSLSAPALHHADIYEVVPRIEHPNYLQCLKDLCHKYKIKGVLSLIDPELELLASWKEEFEEIGVHVILSNRNTVELCFDKYRTYSALRAKGIPIVPTYLSIKEVIDDVKSKKIQFPLIAKPRKGSASLDIHKITSLIELEKFNDLFDDYVVQPFINGEEYGVDCYVDLLSQKLTNVFMKRKIAMRAGETDKSIAIKDYELQQIIEKLINNVEFLGPIDIDCFKTNSGYIVSEINPRFGGGYPHAHEVGHNFIWNIINNLKGKSNENEKVNYKEGSVMVKYDQLIIL
ncbi:ATP-grasp domain-containing protein [Bacillus massiliigorillae]|uniref:ATP-grasp domain-containing protein n=1 Tax=Bacillus massiliigorillae TaxID=1243664 RepID=UPI00039B56F6|nr:ATP-grasp domain-containing protein [Bacillus massiliigorillae]